MIKVILKAPGKRSEVREIEDGHAAIEALLGGKSEQFRAVGYEACNWAEAEALLRTGWEP